MVYEGLQDEGASCCRINALIAFRYYLLLLVLFEDFGYVG